MDWLDGENPVRRRPIICPKLPAATFGGAVHVAPLILNRDPRQVRCIYYEVSKALRGHGNSKAALDMVLGDLAA
jgi:hypothetical protein